MSLFGDPKNSKDPLPAAKPKQAMNIITNNKFQIAIPEEWQDQSIYRFEGPELGGIKHHVNVSVDNNLSTTDVKQYAMQAINSMESELQGYRRLKEGAITLFSQQEAYEHVYKWSPVEEQSLIQRGIYVIADNVAYTLLASFTKESWKELGSEIDLVMKSFKV